MRDHPTGTIAERDGTLRDDVAPFGPAFRRRVQRMLDVTAESWGVAAGQPARTLAIALDAGTP